MTNLSMLLGGTEHTQHLKAERSDWFHKAYQKSILNESMNYFTKTLTKIQTDNFVNKKDLPDWYAHSVANMKLKVYVARTYNLDKKEDKK